MSTVIEWDGVRVPEALRELPPGRYSVEPVEEPVALTREEEEGIVQGLRSLDAGRKVPLSVVMDELRTRRQQ